MSNAASRTFNVFRNAVFGVAGQVLTIIFGFVTRIIFTHTLGAEYLGVNGLFSNVLTVLSLAELGVGNAIVYNMYRPFAEKDNIAIKSLLILYGKIYRIVGILIAALGLAVLPFLDIFLNGTTAITDNLYVLYLMFLANTVLSYFFAYKKSLFVADQKNYVTNIVFYTVKTFELVVQAIVLVVFQQYFLYVLLMVICTLINNLVISIKADCDYPEIKNAAAIPLSKEALKSIFSDIKSLFLYKVGKTVYTSADNLIISATLNIATVGIYSNYILFSSTLTALAEQVINAFTASVGNLNATESVCRKKQIFEDLLYISVWLYGFFAAGLFITVNDMVVLFFGKEYLLPTSVVLLCAALFYMTGVQNPGYMFRTTMGLFRKGRFCPIIAAILNIFLSIFLAEKWALSGIIAATIISRLVTFEIVDPYLIYHKGFQKSVVPYFVRYIAFAILVSAITCITAWFVSFITLGGIWGILLKILAVTVIFNTFFAATTFWSREHKDVSSLVHSLVRQLRSR